MEIKNLNIGGVDEYHGISKKNGKPFTKYTYETDQGKYYSWEALRPGPGRFKVHTEERDFKGKTYRDNWIDGYSGSVSDVPPKAATATAPGYSAGQATYATAKEFMTLAQTVANLIERIEALEGQSGPQLPF